MRVVMCLGLIVIGLAGCTTLGKKAPTQPVSSVRTPEEATPPLHRPNLPAGPSSVGGIIAGQVVDNFNRNPRSRIEIITSGDGDGAPVIQRIDTDERGYFTILNVKPGQAYQLVARSQEGGLLLTGTTWARPPDAKVIIRVSQDFTPPAGSPAAIGTPIPLPGAARAPAEAPTPPIRPQDIVTRPSPGVRESLPVEIRNPWQPPRNVPPAVRPPSPPVPAAPASGGPDVGDPSAGVTPVPSCQLVGTRLVNFALADLEGRPWEYRRDRRGKVVLLDFWGTWCSHCRVSMKTHLAKLHEVYGRSGLEIVGVAYERDRSFAEQVQTVRNVLPSLGVQYRILMGSGDNCPVKRQFQVHAMPTLVLIDENGQIVWRAEGLDDAGFQELKVEVRKHLKLR